MHGPLCHRVDQLGSPRQRNSWRGRLNGNRTVCAGDLCRRLRGGCTAQRAFGCADVRRRMWCRHLDGGYAARRRRRRIPARHPGAAGRCDVLLRHRARQRDHRPARRVLTRAGGGQDGAATAGVLRAHRGDLSDGFAAGRAGDGAGRHDRRRQAGDRPDAHGTGDRHWLERRCVRSDEFVRHHHLRHRACGRYRAEPDAAVRGCAGSQHRVAGRGVLPVRRAQAAARPSRSRP